MKVQVLMVLVVVMAGVATGDEKVVMKYSVPGAVVVGEAPTHAASYIHHAAAAAVPAYRTAALHYTVPQAVHAVRYSVPHAVQYAAPHAVPYAAAPAVGYSPLVYSAAYHQPAAATVIKKKISYEFDEDDYPKPLRYAAAFNPGGVVVDSDYRVPTLYAKLDDDHFEFDDDHFEFENHDDRK